MAGTLQDEKRFFMLELAYWYMLPISIVVATIAMMAGVGGAALFSPLFLIFLGLRPDVALGTGLFIEVFGFASGFYGYAKKHLIDYKLAKEILVFTIPFAIVGAFLAKGINPMFLQFLFAIGMFFLAYAFVKTTILVKFDQMHIHHFRLGGWHYTYRVSKFREQLYFLSGMGGLALGLVSVGLGEVNEYNFLKKMRMNPALAAGTSVFIIIVTASVASISHLIYFFIHPDNGALSTIINILIFAAPGVIIGAQIGVRLVQKVKEDQMKDFLSVLFLIIGALTLMKLFLV